MSAPRFRVAIDRGGTFTDLVAMRDGETRVAKVPSGDVDAVVSAIRELVGSEELSTKTVESVRCGTTVATNALLERRGERSALLVTEGFGDLLRIRDQARPDLFALPIVRPEPLAEVVREIPERVLSDGEIRVPLDEAAVGRAAQQLHAEGVRSVAVLFLHSFAHPEHEVRAGEILLEAGIEHVALSHRVANEVRAVPRGETACADAYLTPLLRRALAELTRAFDTFVDVRVMQSHGGLADTQLVSGPRAVLSGPAGGVVATAAVARGADAPRAIGLDMGGTSTDVCRVAGEPELRFETDVGGVKLRVPSLRVETVAAGGGSVLSFDGRRLRVGPESAGADPGPAGYGRGGPATLTDANAVLGRIVPDLYPRCFGPHRDAAFDVAASRTAVAALAVEAGMTVEEAAAGFVRIAVERMAQAIREVSVAEGHDVRKHALVVFGGAGGQHACALARALGVQRVLFHRLGSVLSAWGIAHATPGEEVAQAFLRPLTDASVEEARLIGMRLLEMVTVAVRRGVAGPPLDWSQRVEARYAGVDATLVIDVGEAARMRAAFHELHRARYGFARPGEPVEIVSVRVHARERRSDPALGRNSAGPLSPPGPVSRAKTWFGGLRETPVHSLTGLGAAASVLGPALVVDDVTTIVVEPGFGLRNVDGEIYELTPLDPTPQPRATTARDPLHLTLFANAFRSIAERMGAMLERVAHSTNIKERLDFSCALFDADGRLLVSAPHVPVHLGAMGQSVRAIRKLRNGRFREGDAIATNDPYEGGSHLPDVTLVTPVLVESGSPAFFVANRAHHADVGGVTPGSMPPHSTRIDEEGVRIHDLLVVRDGVFDEPGARTAFDAGQHPARNPDERMSDLRAQAAANAEGARLVAELAYEHEAGVVAAYAGHVLDDAAEAMEELLRELPDGAFAAEDRMDDGTRLAVSVVVAGSRATVDFDGTGPRAAGNLNAPHAVTHAAVLFALRLLVKRDVPLNEGCLRPIEIRIPAGSLLDPAPPCAVVGGNVETSMRLVDLVLAALGACAGGQGTMNNVAFGPVGGGLTYYETICGGTGAGPGFPGASAVQSHMTNTRITDPEVLELRHPVILRRFAIRKESGGAGAMCGGDGVIREIEARAALRGGVLSGRRDRGGPGLAGGVDGKPGQNRVLRGGGAAERLGASASFALEPGDALRIETPGGGGHGVVTPRRGGAP